jgi:hypothetical protein
VIRSVLHKVLGSVSHAHMARDPFFAFDETVVELLVESKPAQQSFYALREHGLIHLPYPQMTVQFKRHSSNITWVLWLRERLDGSFDTELFYVHNTGRCEAVSETRISIGETGDITSMFNVDGSINPDIRFRFSTGGGVSAEETDDMLVSVSCAGLMMAVLMTHIGGLEREEHEAPEKLNAARERKGKPPIRRYSYIHVGHVYGSDGTKHDYNKTGRRMPIHMRAGHNRNQAYGEGHSERKLIWIPPVLVNYDGKTEPVLEKRVVL